MDIPNFKTTDEVGRFFRGMAIKTLDEFTNDLGHDTTLLSRVLAEMHQAAYRAGAQNVKVVVDGIVEALTEIAEREKQP